MFAEVSRRNETLTKIWTQTNIRKQEQLKRNINTAGFSP